MVQYIKCFSEELDKEESYRIFDAGLRVIEVKKIVGTVDKCGELDEDFRYVKRKDRVEWSRWRSLRIAASNYQTFPAIEVYKYKDFFYVIDGNRRVAVAKALNMEFIDANVKEYIPKSDKSALNGTFLRRRFENDTGLKNIYLTHEIGYRVLLEEVSSFRGESIIEKAKNWYSEFYLPACGSIKKSTLLSEYPDLSEGDIFVIITEFYREFMGGYPENTGFQTLISGFMFARKITERRAYRKFPFKVLRRLFGLKGRKE
jgi:hypothetical protein